MRRVATLLLAFFLPFLCFTTNAQTNRMGQPESMMGFARAVEVTDGNIFIGEPANVHQPGIVYYYNRIDTGWSQQGQLSATDGEVGNGFGAALSANKNQILIGAPKYADKRGATYLFSRNGDSWEQSARITLADTSLRSRLGASVVLSDDMAFIGAPGEQKGIGAVYVYQRSDNGSWMQKARIANPDTSKGFGFGSALAAGDSRLLVGAPQKKAGAVFVYQRGDDGKWSRKDVISSDEVDQNARFGSHIAIKNDQVFVSAHRQAAGTGAVFVFQYKQENDLWTQSGRLVAFDGGPRYRFGASLALLDDKVMVGAPGADEDKGALYQFSQNEKRTEWISVKKIQGPDRKRNSRFAGTMAIDDGIAVVGLVGADYGAGTAAILKRKADTRKWSVQTTVIGTGTKVLEPITGNKINCTNGTAGKFSCKNVNLLSFMPIDALGGSRGIQVNDIWGWTDSKTGIEYALVGRMDGTAFVDVSDPQNPVYVGSLPLTESAHSNIWRDIKVYKHYAYVVADNAGEHGMQVFDLTKLRRFEGEPITFESDTVYERVHSAHNVVVNKSSGYAYIVGASGGGKTCGGGLHMVNIKDPLKPTFEGCFADRSTGRSGTGYSHDAQCVTYHGPDSTYKGHEICIGANETAISIADVTNKDNPKAISTASYPNYGYVHQGWLTEDHRYFYQDDELDEIAGNVDRTRTLIWDVTDLDDPQLVKQYYFDNKSSDHNLYIKDGTAYLSNYVSGLQILDVSDPANPVKVGAFDTQPFTSDDPGFAGTWSNYPFFKNDIVIMTSMQEGLFILRKQKTKDQNL